MELMKELAEPERGLCQQQVIGMMGDLEQQATPQQAIAAS